MKWSMFMISIGFLIIATSAFTPFKYINIILGIALVTIGYNLYRKYKREEKNDKISK